MNSVKKSAVFLAAINLVCLLSFRTTWALALQDTVSVPVWDSRIRLNQIGFYPGGTKIAIVLLQRQTTFSLLDARSRRRVYSGRLRPSGQAGGRNSPAWIADFSAFTRPGHYILNVDGAGCSFPFAIQPALFKPLGKALLKAYYYQRASTALPEAYGGAWHRAAGHPDDQVIIHPSAAGPGRPAGTAIAAAGGWYDAGDYNKYMVNSGISTATLLSLYEDFPEQLKKISLNIPESRNGVPDLLNEVLWNVRWMLKMQDPADGGVYHKLTNAGFDGMVMPENARSPRYVVQKSTPAALDFAAVMAQTSRVVQAYSRELPGLSDSCLRAALKAWAWARANPAVVYDQDRINRLYSPEITTGSYSDRDFSDEFIWAACELYVTTRQQQFYTAVPVFPDRQMPLPSWSNVRLLGYYTLARYRTALTGPAKYDFPALQQKLVHAAGELQKAASASPFQTSMGHLKTDFSWGSNAVAANQGILLIQAYRLSGNPAFLKAALSGLDYLLGRNGTGYAYVAGFGSKTPLFPHHRPSAADGIISPVPGFMVGGPNPGMQDGIPLPSMLPEQAYTDQQAAYATNEVAINWNAAIAYLVQALEVLQPYAADRKTGEKQ